VKFSLSVSKYEFRGTQCSVNRTLLQGIGRNLPYFVHILFILGGWGGGGGEVGTADVRKFELFILFLENRLSESCTLLEGVNNFVSEPSTFIV
jgi:hypothetical protein